MRRQQVLAILSGLLVAIVLSSLSQGTVLTALPAIGRDLGDAEHLPWLLTSFLVASTVSVPLLGKLADVWGRRVTLVSALAIFLVGSILCATAQSMSWMIASRTIQGAGGGALIALCLIVMADAIPPLERARYQILIVMVNMVGNLGGPVVGGFIVQYLDWRYVFWINVPLGLFAMVRCMSALRALPLNHRPQKIDVPGAILLTMTTIILQLAIIGTGALWSTIALSCVAAGLWILFGWWLLHSSAPLIAPHLLLNPIIRNSTISAAFSTSSLLAVTVYLPLYGQTVLGFTASRSGGALLPLIVGATIGAIIAGQIMPRYARYRRVGIWGLAVAAIALLAMAAVINGQGSSRLLEGLSFIAGLGLGTVPPLTLIAAQNATALHELGVMTASNNYVRQLFNTVAVAGFGAVISRSGIKQVVENGAGTLPALVHAFALVCLGTSALAVLGLVFLWQMEERPLRATHDLE